MKKMNKKGVELSLNVIIIAIIVIIVLVVVVIIFGGKINVFSKSTVSCSAKGGYCANPDMQTRGCPAGEIFLNNTDCTGQICCLKVLS